MHKLFFTRLMTLLSVVLLTACGVPDLNPMLQSPTPRSPASGTTSVLTTPTPAPPTLVPEPPTASPIPPEATLQQPVPTAPPQAGTANNDGDDPTPARTILDGMALTRSAKVFRLEEQTAGKGGFERLLVYLGLQDPKGEGLIHSSSLECNAADCATLITGGTATLFGADRDRGLESLTVNGDGYIRGPLLYSGLTEDRWYREPGQPNPFAISRLTSTELYGYVDNAAYPGVETEERLATFSLPGRETLDGLGCDVYSTADKEVTIDAMRAKIGGNLSISDATDFEGDGTTEFKIRICDDGYFHQMEMHFVGTDNTRPDTPVERSYRLHIFDFDADIFITPPAEAITITPTPS